MIQYYRKYYPCKFKGALGRIVGESEEGEWIEFHNVKFNSNPLFKTPKGKPVAVPLNLLEELDSEEVAFLEKVECDTGQLFEEIYPQVDSYLSINDLKPGYEGYVQLNGKEPNKDELTEYIRLEIQYLMNDFVGIASSSGMRKELSISLEDYLNKISGDTFRNQASVNVFINPSSPDKLCVEPANLYTLILINGVDQPPYNLPEEGDWCSDTHRYHFSTHTIEDGVNGTVKCKKILFEVID